jgi:hypothetical protein
MKSCTMALVLAITGLSGSPTALAAPRGTVKLTRVKEAGDHLKMVIHMASLDGKRITAWTRQQALFKYSPVRYERYANAVSGVCQGVKLDAKPRGVTLRSIDRAIDQAVRSLVSRAGGASTLKLGSVTGLSPVEQAVLELSRGKLYKQRHLKYAGPIFD